jgi:hypothetical protein
VDTELRQELKKQIVVYIRTYRRFYKLHTYISHGVVAAGLLLGTGVTVAGFADEGRIAGGMGVAITALIGFQSAFSFSEKAAFYHSVHDRAKVLRDRLRYKVDTVADFRAVVDDMESLRMFAVNELPRGVGMKAVENMQANRGSGT